MHRFLLAAAVLLAWSPALAAEDVTPLPPGSSDSPKPPKMDLVLDDFSLHSEDFNFPSGLRVIMQPDHTQPLVGITMWVDRGSSSDPIGKEGIAHYVEHLWFKSKHGEGIPMVWDLLAEMGCYLNASTSNDWTNYMTVCPTEAFPIMLKLESLRLAAPLAGVTEAEMLAEREVVRNELRMRMEVGGGEMIRYLMGDVYPEGHPYHRETIGTHESLSEIELADIQAFVEENYKPELATIVVVGDFDPELASSLIIEHFNPENLHPDLKPEHSFYYPRPGVEEPDPDSPDDWFLGAWDPAAPGERPLPMVGEPPVRISDKGLEPPSPAEQVNVHEAPLRRPVVSIAWSLPGGYRGQDALWGLVAGFLNSQLWWRFEDPAHLHGLEGDDRIYTDPRTDTKSIGCSYWAERVNSTLFCFAELADTSVDGARLADDMIDQVSEVWNPENTQGARFFGRSKLMQMREILLSVDVVASLSGRAFQIAQHAHYTGSPIYHSDAIEGATTGTIHEAQALAFEWLQRNRAVVSVMKPIPDDELVLDSSEAAWHGAQSESDVIKKTAIDLDAVTAAFIAGAAHPPDLDRVTEKVLPNGLRVVVMPHGEAPLAKARLLITGGSDTGEPGLFSFANTFSEDAELDGTEHDPLSAAGRFSSEANSTHTWFDFKGSSGNLDAALWTIREEIEELRPYTAGKGDWARRQKKWLVGSWMVDDPSWFVSRLSSEHWNPGHPLTWSASYDDYSRMAKWRSGDVKALQQRLFQPANATLLVVGKVDPEEALALAETYFGGWRADPGVEIGPGPVLPPPNPGKPARVVLFDDPGKTQTQVTAMCPIGPVAPEQEVAASLLADVLDDRAWTILREQSGATYGAGAQVDVWPGGSARVAMSSMVQNDATPLAVQTFQQLVEDAEAGEVDADRLTVLKLNRARKYVIGHQSIDQMTSRLTGGVIDGWDSVSTYGDAVAAVDVPAIQEVASGCAEHLLVTLTGPEQVVAPLLDEAGLEFEVYDWRAEAGRLLAQHDPKSHKKWLKEQAEKETSETKEDAVAEDE